MSRMLRHVETPDRHDRIPMMSTEGRVKISAEHTEMLQETIREISRRIVLSDEMWTVWYAVKDELLERGAWDEELGLVNEKGE